jgi:hypothetical protein
MAEILCKYCGLTATAKCGSCRAAHYCGLCCQKNDWINGHSTSCGKREREETRELYIFGNGKYQDLHNFMSRTLTEVGTNDDLWYTRPQNKVLKFYNAIMGIYYGHFNDGDDIDGAIENNRAHGIRNMDQLKMLAREINAPKKVRDFINRDRFNTEEQYESAMDETILFVDQQAFRNKNRIMMEKALQELGMDREAAKSLAEFHSKI